MKTIYFVRHGKASWDDISLADRDRPLLPKGVRRTLMIADFLKNKQIKPDRIIASDALRAQATAHILAGELGCDTSTVLTESRIYDSFERDVFSIVAGLDNDLGSVMLVGHNPGMTRVAEYYAPQDFDYMPTSGTVAVKFHTDKWEDLPLAKFEHLFFVSPAMLRPKEH
jgi:phosphohistidine phosphatase